MSPNPNNVTSIESKKPGAIATHTISYVLDGFSITTTLETTAGIQDVVARLRAIGATPPAAQASTPEKPAGAPSSCPQHGKAKPSKKPGFVYCPETLPDGGYCRWTSKA